jgi:hypothetical protein
MANLPKNGEKCEFEDCINFEVRSTECKKCCPIKIKEKQDRTDKCFKCGAILVLDAEYGVNGGVELENWASYGSNYDGNFVHIYVCDDCIGSVIKVDRERD